MNNREEADATIVAQLKSPPRRKDAAEARSVVEAARAAIDVICAMHGISAALVVLASEYGAGEEPDAECCATILGSEENMAKLSVVAEEAIGQALEQCELERKRN